ncbi:MAG: carboxypeptidase regulatory-like domain-containing protein [Acidobacteria bacterium]|nr:MAG: carboxypeptidase regulatory-like domain-containing protein [Acidobacteriota bacterium]
MTSLLLLAFLLQGARDTTPQRPAPAGTAVIGGTVTTGEAGAKRPLRRAVVSLAGTAINGVRQAVTDDAGRFVFDRLAPGRFTLIAEKPGYLKTYLGSRRPGNPPAAPISVIDGQQLLDVAIDVPKGGVVDGTVRDETGAPLASAQVMVQQMTYVMGERRFIRAAGGPAWAVTDDRGHYRIWGLPPGEYTARAGTMSAPILTDAEFKLAETQLQTGRVPPAGTRAAGPQLQRGMAYFPGVADVTMAQTITLGLSEERTGVDIVSAPVPAFDMEYIGVSPGGLPITQVSIGLASLSRQSLYFSPGIVRMDAMGRGAVRGLAPGRYLFFGRGTETTDANAPEYWLEAEVDLSAGHATGVRLQFVTGSRVSGRIRSTGAPLPPFGVGARVQLNPAPLIAEAALGARTATVNPDGSFAVVNVPPGRYRVEVGGVSGWSAVSAVSQGIDTLDVPLSVSPSVDVSDLAVSITDRLTEISGLVTDAAGRPVPEYSVMVFSQDRNLWSSPRRFSGAVRISTDGKYRVAGLPPGAYFLAVVTDVDPLQSTDPTFLEQLMTGAVSIRLTDGQKVVQDLRIGG